MERITGSSRIPGAKDGRKWLHQNAPQCKQSVRDATDAQVCGDISSS